jgi:signal transduction histidine kinase
LEAAYAHQRDLSDRLSNIRDEERARLAHQIRDELGGTLAGLKMDIVRLKRMAEANRPSLPQELDALARFLDEIVVTVRQMSMELYPSVLDDFGLAVALNWYLDHFRERSGLNSEFVTDAPDLVIEHAVALQIFRVFQEALTNIARHAQATQVRVNLTQAGNFLVLEIRDNGRGISDVDAARRTSFSLTAMNDRVLALSGRFSITSTIGQGTSVVVEVPLSGPPPV